MDVGNKKERRKAMSDFVREILDLLGWPGAMPLFWYLQHTLGNHPSNPEA